MTACKGEGLTVDSLPDDRKGEGLTACPPIAVEGLTVAQYGNQTIYAWRLSATHQSKTDASFQQQSRCR
ncbi:hypothetical protein QUB68_25465 [Microcoleus sp. A006_D1]|uniref:hypothetical protein n=1 Tax=Microcoleus sp. A006_D1 TaxID=3055267 RepID=UPI002FD5DF5F